MPDRSMPWIGTLVALILGASVVLPLHAKTAKEGQAGTPIAPGRILVAP